MTCDHILGLEYAICNYVYPVALHGTEQNSWLTVRIVLRFNWLLFWQFSYAVMWSRYGMAACDLHVAYWDGLQPAMESPPASFNWGCHYAIQIVLHSCLVIKKYRVEKSSTISLRTPGYGQVWTWWCCIGSFSLANIETTEETQRYSDRHCYKQWPDFATTGTFFWGKLWVCLCLVLVMLASNRS